MRTALLVVLAVFVVVMIVQVVTLPGVVDSARDLLDGTITEDEFEDSLGLYGFSGLVTFPLQIATVVLSVIWLFRIAKNHQTLSRRLTWTPGWAISGWVLPPLVLYIIPLLMLRESWKAADPDVPPGDERWRSNGDSPLIWIWWVLYGLAPIIFIAVAFGAQFRTSNADLLDSADFFDDRFAVLLAQSVVTVLAAAAWALVVRALSDRHRRLTGELAR